MRSLLAGILFALVAGTVQAEEIVSAYTRVDTESGCSVFAEAGEKGGDWRNLVCTGYKGYPVLIYYSDARESIFYGFPPPGDMAPVWESFTSFNRAGPTIEWRIARDGEREVPFATIHRWFVSDPDDPEDQIEVLVVEKVGQIGLGEGCAVGYVAAAKNERANEQARRIADNQARDFACGADQPAIDAGDIPVPDFTRGGS